MAARILVADDSVTIQKVVELTFSKEDFVLVQARSGEEAIRRAKEERPDLVLLDLVMPDKNGYEVCAALRAEPMLRAVPIILLTGTFEAFDKDKGIQAGADDFVTKPFESQVLISKVKQLLFTKTVDLASTGGPAGPTKAVPPKEAPRPVSTTVGLPPRGIPPRPSPASGPPRGVGPSVMRGGVSPPSTLSSPFQTVVLPPRSLETPAPSPAASVPPAAVQASPASTMPPLASGRPVPPAPIMPLRVTRTLDLSPPTEEFSQDRVRSVVEPPSSLPPSPTTDRSSKLSPEDLTTLLLPETAGRPGEPHLERERAVSGPAAVPEELSSEMLSLAPKPDQSEKAAPPSEMRGAGLPKTLSLEDLLSGEVSAAPLTGEAAITPLDEEVPGGGPVFDLTSELRGPSLPLVEVGRGEPPALSIEEILGSAEVAPPPPTEMEPTVAAQKTPPEEFPEESVFELTSAQEMLPPPPVEAGAEVPSALFGEDLLHGRETAPSEDDKLGLQELELELPSGAPAEAPARGPDTTAAPLLDFESLVEAPLSTDEGVSLGAVPGEEQASGPPQVVPPPGVLPPAPAREVGATIAEVPAAALTLPETPAAPPSLGEAQAPLPEMAAMRREVTDRVAHDLARELSDRLLDRVERIVWEVVPDLAEVLITKEIERIRSQAEGK
jgi:CheY-like chemotaxis protein